MRELARSFRDLLEQAAPTVDSTEAATDASLLARTARRAAGWLLPVAAVTAAANPAEADDIYLQLGGGGNCDIAGDATSKTFLDAIEVLSWSWGVSNSSSWSIGMVNRSAGNAALSELKIIKNIDVASAELVLMSLLAPLGCDAALSVVDPDLFVGNETPYLTIELEGVILSNVSHGSSNAQDRIETLTLGFSNMKMTHFELDTKGVELSKDEFCWSIISNDNSCHGL